MKLSYEDWKPDQGSVITLAEACWGVGMTNIEEVLTTAVRLGIVIPALAQQAQPEMPTRETLTMLKYDTAVAFAAGFRKALGEYDIDTGSYTVEGDFDSANVVPYAKAYAEAHDPARYFSKETTQQAQPRCEKCPECGGAYDDVLTIGTAESHGVTVAETRTTYRPHKDGCMFGLRPVAAPQPEPGRAYYEAHPMYDGGVVVPWDELPGHLKADARAAGAQPEPERCSECRAGKKCSNCVWDDYENGRVQPEPEDALADHSLVDNYPELAAVSRRRAEAAALRAVSQPTEDAIAHEIYRHAAGAVSFSTSQHIAKFVLALYGNSEAKP